MSDILNRALLLIRQGNLAVAEAELTRHLKVYPKDVEAVHLRGIARGKLGKFVEGAADLDWAVEHHPQPFAVLNNLGNLWRNSGDSERALSSYEKAITLSPSFIDAHYNKGISHFDLGRLDEAATAYRRVLEINPKHIGSLNALGVLSMQSEDFDAAFAFFNKALELEPQSGNVRVNRGCLHRKLGQLQEAKTDFTDASEMAPHLSEPPFQLASLFRVSGDHDAAKQCYFSAIRADPYRADVHRDFASLSWEMGDGISCTAVLEEALKRQPSARLFSVHAEILMRMGEAERALVSASSAVDLDSNFADGLALKGNILDLLGQHDEALSDLTRAHQKNSLSGGEKFGDFTIRHKFVEAQLRAGEFKKALELLEPEANLKHLQKHVGLKSLAWRASHDDRYRRFYNYDEFTRKMFIETPPGYASLDDFNKALLRVIERLHKTEAQPLDQTLFGGTQTDGRLWDVEEPEIQALGVALMVAAKDFVEALPDDEEHPFLRQKSHELELTGAWSVRLKSGGGHVDHIHPEGWISACYYISVPESVMQGERSGWLRLGASGVSGLELPAERYVMPEPGAVIFFPSYMWHGVEPFFSDQVRVTAPFDLLPSGSKPHQHNLAKPVI